MTARVPEGINDYSTNTFNINITVLPSGPCWIVGAIAAVGWAPVGALLCFQEGPNEAFHKIINSVDGALDKNTISFKFKFYIQRGPMWWISQP